MAASVVAMRRLGRHNLSLFLIILFMAGFVAPRAIAAAQINYAALQYWTSPFPPSAAGQSTLTLPPSHPRAIYWRAARAHNAAEWETVLALMKPFAAKGDALAQQYVGRSYEALGDYPSAIASWQQLNDWRQLYRIGRLAQGKEQTGVAIQAHFASWQIDPKFATNQLAMLLMQQGDFAGAEEVYRRAIRVTAPYNHRQPIWRQGLARLLMEQERWDEAVAAWEEVVRTASLNEKVMNQVDQIYYEMAWAYHMNGQNKEALATIEQAIEQSPKTDYLLRAGEIYKAANESEKALHIYRRVLAIDPNQQTAREAIDRLRNDP